MERTTVDIAGVVMDLYRLDTLVVGSGAAGLNAADRLSAWGIPDVAILTEGADKGTSVNTGSDKQTYFKLNLAGAHPDSVRAMAESLFAGGAMHGDIALVQAALSPVCFARLVDIGVPFPHNEFGEYVGYRNDHDESTRATSAGPLTSQAMGRCLGREVRARGIPVLEGMQAVALGTAAGDGPDSSRRVLGLLALDTSGRAAPRFALFQCARRVWAAGGPAGLYADSVYPPSQTGSTGIALEAGAPARNLSEWQYGIASTRFRWNLSGTYQQVLPRYVSTLPDGSDEREFLPEYFDDTPAALAAVFLKGYQWPFDPRKLGPGGSSVVDVAVFRESRVRGRRVFLDYRSNPRGAGSPLTPETVGAEAYAYLARSGALDRAPIDRLRRMNPGAVRLYAAHGIDLAAVPLEVAVCAQHHNGGLAGDIWWQSPLRGFYPVGEANGSFGVYRPGGSALNETQAGSRRAAQHIALQGPAVLPPVRDFTEAALPVVRGRMDATAAMAADAASPDARLAPGPFRRRLQRRMSDFAGFLRDPDGMRSALADCLAELADPAAGQRLTAPRQLAMALRNIDLLLAQAACLTAMLDMADHRPGSRGGWLLLDPAGDRDCAGLRFSLAGDGPAGEAQTCVMEPAERADPSPPGQAWHRPVFTAGWERVRPIPPDDAWFENDWAQYRSRWSVTEKEDPTIC